MSLSFNSSVLIPRRLSSIVRTGSVVFTILLFSLSIFFTHQALASVVFQSTQTSGASTLNQGLVGYWPFNNQDMNWATNKALDRSGKGNDGTLVSMSTTTSPVQGKVGQGLGFDGSTSYIAVSTSTTSYFPTVSAWIKTTATCNPTSCAVIAGLGSGNVDIPIYDGKLNTYTVNDGKWHHVVAKWQSGTTYSYYIDGSYRFDYSSPSVSTKPLIGVSYNGGYSLYWNGSLDDVRVYNRALSAAEIKQLYLMGCQTQVNTASVVV